jgi:hypothetical protein
MEQTTTTATLERIEAQLADLADEVPGDAGRHVERARAFVMGALADLDRQPVLLGR